MLRGRPTSIPFGFPPRSPVARGTWLGTRARLMPITSPTCFFGPPLSFARATTAIGLLVFLVISSPHRVGPLARQTRHRTRGAEDTCHELIPKNQGDAVVERQLTVFDEHDLPALGKHRRDHL